MKKDDLVYVGHMLETAKSAHSKVAGIDRAAFDADENLRLALAHLVQIVGEAAARVSNDFRAVHPEIPWRLIVGMRQKFVHDYIHVDYDIVWGVVTADLPPLIEQLATMLPEEKTE
jgi:uncharacterized protein with HEPN domain